MTVRLYLLTQDKFKGYDTYDSAVVVAGTPNRARHIHPSSYIQGEWWKDDWQMGLDSWPLPKDVTVEYLGVCRDPEYKSGDVVCASFNAG